MVLCETLVRKHMGTVEPSVLRSYLRGFRDEPSTPLNLDFDAFVEVYNSIVGEQRRGGL